MNFNFGEVLGRAWQIVWKHKILWVFGILASCNANRGSFNFNNSMNYQEDAGNLPPQVLEQLNQAVENIIPIIAILVAVFCLIVILSVFLGTVGRIGLIRGTTAVEDGTEHLAFGQLFRESLPFFWRSFWLWILVGLPFFFLALLMLGLVAVGMIALFTNGAQDTALVGLLGMLPVLLICSCIIGLLSWVVSLIGQQAQNAIVVDGLGTLPSLSRGWEVFKKNLGPIFVMAIILAVIGFAVGLVIAIPVLMIVFPTMMAFFIGQGESMTPLILLGLCMLVFIPVSLVINGIFSSYYEAAWTLTYLRLTRKPEETIVPAEANA